MSPTIPMRLLALCVLGLTACETPANHAVSSSVAASVSPVPVGAEVKRLAGSMGFVEGPVWLPKENGLIFSDIPKRQLMHWTPTEGLTVGASRPHPNGNALDGLGRLVTCQHGDRNIVARDGNGQVTVLVDRFGDRRFNSPNDLVIAADGVIWFTDPPWGLEDQRVGRELNGHFVFRFDPNTGDVKTVLEDRCMPNGIGLSPDEGTLYVSDTGGHPSHPGPTLHGLPATISAYRILGDTLDREPIWRVETRCDGMCIDDAGRIYATGDDAVTVWSPDGVQLDAIPVPETPANVCLGGATGRTLFITARTSLYSVELLPSAE